MYRKEDDGETDSGAARLAWAMFEKTGSISYYMLYKDLKRKR